MRISPLPRCTWPQRLFDLLEVGALTVQFSVVKERVALRKLMDKYADLPISLADACLIRLAELIPAARVFTTDSDFSIYRKNGRQIIPVIAPDR